MIEYYSCPCTPKNEKSFIDFYKNFGWTPFISNENIENNLVYNLLNCELLNAVKTNEYLMKITFKRDTNMPHYSELKELEDKYKEVPKNIYKSISPIWIILIVFGALFICGFVGTLVLAILLGPLFIALPITNFLIGTFLLIFGIVGLKKNIKKDTRRKNLNRKNDLERKEIFNQAKAVMSEIEFKF